jgi:hypothetical protein
LLFSPFVIVHLISPRLLRFHVSRIIYLYALISACADIHQSHNNRYVCVVASATIVIIIDINFVTIVIVFLIVNQRR